jgi:hypothetical protein
MEIYLGDHQIWSTLSTSLLTVLLMWVAYIVVGMVDKFVITPMRIKRIMNRQGVKGPYSHLFLGNMPEFIALAKAEEEKDMKTGDYDIVSHILPFYVQNCQAYGEFFPLSPKFSSLSVVLGIFISPCLAIIIEDCSTND